MSRKCLGERRGTVSACSHRSRLILEGVLEADRRRDVPRGKFTEKLPRRLQNLYDSSERRDALVEELAERLEGRVGRLAPFSADHRLGDPLEAEQLVPDRLQDGSEKFGERQRKP